MGIAATSILLRQGRPRRNKGRLRKSGEGVTSGLPPFGGPIKDPTFLEWSWPRCKRSCQIQAVQTAATFPTLKSQESPHHGRSRTISYPLALYDAEGVQLSSIFASRNLSG